MQSNDDDILGDQFDECLMQMITQLTEQLSKATEPIYERSKAVILGKRELVNLLLEKTLEYLKTTDPKCQDVVQDIVIQFEYLMDSALDLAKPVSQSNAPIAKKKSITEKNSEFPSSTHAFQIRQKDAEIARL